MWAQTLISKLLECFVFVFHFIEKFLKENFLCHAYTLYSNV